MVLEAPTAGILMTTSTRLRFRTPLQPSHLLDAGVDWDVEEVVGGGRYPGGAVDVKPESHMIQRNLPHDMAAAFSSEEVLVGPSYRLW